MYIYIRSGVYKFKCANILVQFVFLLFLFLYLTDYSAGTRSRARIEKSALKKYICVAFVKLGCNRKN